MSGFDPPTDGSTKRESFHGTQSYAQQAAKGIKYSRPMKQKQVSDDPEAPAYYDPRVLIKSDSNSDDVLKSKYDQCSCFHPS